MLQSQREKLQNRTSDWMAIGVTQTGEPVRSIHVPWYYDTNAYNMKTPDIFLEPGDLLGGELMEELAALKVVGFYAFCPLPDYGVLTLFSMLWDLNLYHAQGITDLDFVTDLPELRMLFLEGATLPNLDLLFGQRRREFRCLGMYDCRVENLDSLRDYPGYLSEIIVANPKNRDERARWKDIQPKKVRYYDLKG